MRVWVLLLLAVGAAAVDRTNFKLCAQSGFCKRHRAVSEPTGYEVVADSVKFNETAFKATIKNKENSLQLTIVALKDSTVRVLIDEKDGVRKRYQPLDALVKPEPEQQKLKKTKTDEKASRFITEDGHRVAITHKPFRIDFFAQEKLVSSINAHGLLKFDHWRAKEKIKDGENFWAETFKEWKDTKPYGSSSVGVDITFASMKYVYGLPEHTDGLALRETKSYEPYRLYNLDVFEYEIGSPMALYGAVPYLTALNPKRSVGMLWLNAAETWVDVDYSTADKSPLMNVVDKDDKQPTRIPMSNTRFMSESGLIDVFMFLGPKVVDVHRQLTKQTGVTPLPPKFALGYHQSRWNYNDEKDVQEVHENFDKHEIPLDVLWLDIEHTDDKKYFTFDPVKFPTPEKMLEKFAEKGRKMVAIVDPHIKKDDEYHVYKEALDQGLFVRETGGKKTYEGHCWPGTSSYLDFLNPKTRAYWASKFALDSYKGSTNDLHIWNDMNEPSVFNGPEITMNKDAVHYGEVEHREVHNIYGFQQHTATFEGLKARSKGEQRPFVLSRSFFAGSQRTAAVWTGDNTADWRHLKASVPMLLGLSVAGIPFVGADVGGFFGNPEPELLARWYQAAAYQPFFRAHAHLDSPRREPWLYDANITESIKLSIKRRYQMLPLWYTLFYEHEKTGKPVMRPVWMEFPEDESCYDEDRQWMLGNALLVKPNTEPGSKQTSLYLPGRREVWYEWETSRARPGPGAVQVDTDLTKIAVFQRGGTIVVAHDEVGHATSQMNEQPVTLYIALDMKGTAANGTVYLDNGDGYGYKNGECAYWGIQFKREHDYLHTITNKNLDKNCKLESEVYIERVIIRGVKFFPRTAHIYLDDFTPDTLDFEHNRETYEVEIGEVGGYLTKEFRIDLHS